MSINEQNYVDEAEKVILTLKENRSMITTSKIRNLLSMTMDIYNEIMNQREEQLSAEICSRIEYLRVRFLYEAGRDISSDKKKDSPVKQFVKRADIPTLLKNINGSKKNFILFTRYMEALVAFHKYYGGKD